MPALMSCTNTMGLRGRKLRWTITAISVIGFSLFGYDQGLMSGIITAQQFNDEFPATGGDSHRTTVIQGAVVSCYELGCFFGAVFTLFRGEKIGRRPLMLLGAVLMVIGAIISVTPFKGHWALGQFVVGRVVSGLGNGMNTATIPVWQSEMSKPKNRGLLVNLEGTFIAVGTLWAYWIVFGTSYAQTSVQWRFPIAFQIVFAFVIFAGAFFLPESPRWLIAQGRSDEAKQVLFALEGDAANKEEIESEAKVIRDTIDKTGGQGGLSELFTNGKTQHFRRMLIGASTQFFQQFTGCNAAIYYSTVLFQTSLNQPRRLSLVLGGVFATVYALSTIPSFFTIEKLGRRKLFLIGATGQGIAFTITMACLAAPENENNAKGAAVGLYLFIFFFAWSVLQLPWVYPPEINPLRTRTAAVSVSTCTNWICNFAVVMFTPLFISSTRWGAYLFFALMNFLWIPIIYFFYPETAGRRLEEIDLIFAKAHIEHKPAYRVAKEMPKLSAAEIEAEAEKIGLFEPMLDTEASASTVDSTSSRSGDASDHASIANNKA
ncbi:General substrate transporter [Kalmanozyma brasiliensis GHG001]|uniref:Major facilitator superfamily (MFS) profile domain-containing protein n=1 Tax=Kalmanozyma brasiliensis (strain GHG001) TaxID=1365824 RepID=V5EDN3_KALBG|nr:General substrate transporter [Kalmanozyma brasiliensis GHG001]EST08561.1 General substrate transporter [Kalmanozyma brasiliensis GHG001]